MSRWEQSQKYTVYNNKTDMPVAVCATSRECAKAMGVRMETFYAYLTDGRSAKWTIMPEGKCSEIEPPSRKTVAQAMRECRRARGLSLTQFSKVVGIATDRIARYESGEIKPYIDTLIFIADALDITLDELVGRKKR